VKFMMYLSERCIFPLNIGVNEKIFQTAREKMCVKLDNSPIRLGYYLYNPALLPGII
jgi:hypothetical protein